MHGKIRELQWRSHGSGSMAIATKFRLGPGLRSILKPLGGDHSTVYMALVIRRLLESRIAAQPR